MARGWIARGMAVLAVVGFAMVGAVSPAVAADSIVLESITLDHRSSDDVLHQNLTAPGGHTVRVHVPLPLADYWLGVGGAVCTPSTGSERDCAINPQGNAYLRYKFPIAPDSLADQTFTVTVTDLDSDPQSSDTATVSIVRRADLDLEFLGVLQAGPVGGFYPQVRYSYVNRGPSESLPATLTLTFSGSVVFGSLPYKCTRSGMVVTCELGSQEVWSPRAIQLDLNAASGSFTVHGVLASPTPDPHPGNNSKQSEWIGLNNPNGGGSGGGGAGGSGGGGASGGGAPASPSTTPTVVAAAGASPSTAPIDSAAPSRSLAAQPAGANSGSGGMLWWITAAVIGAGVAAGVGLVLLRRRREAVAGSRHDPL